MKRSFWLIVIVVLAVSSCKKKDDPITPATKNPVTGPQVKINIENVVNGEILALKTGNYTNEKGESFNVTMYKYYISNIVLVKEDGTEFKEPESYHLINEEIKDSKQILLKDLPAGKYTKIRFVMGVDSLRNVSGAQTGALDPINNMFWSWNTGYIMAKMEGSSPQSKGFNKTVVFHIGGFNGLENVIRQVDLDLPAAVIADSNKTPAIYIRSDVAEWFKTPASISFDKANFIHLSGQAAVGIANNYADMFSANRVEQ